MFFSCGLISHLIGHHTIKASKCSWFLGLHSAYITYLDVENLPDVGQLVVAYIKFLEVLVVLKQDKKI